MPVNSFDDYPMSWTPDREDLKFPLYYSLADLMERDIKSGKLSANTKLPPQRELADYLDLNLSTITKAYKLCEMRGLIHALYPQGAARYLLRFLFFMYHTPIIPTLSLPDNNRVWAFAAQYFQI